MGKLKTPTLANILFILVISLLIWFIGPLINIRHSSPLTTSSSRLFVILLLLFSLFIKHLFSLFATHRQYFLFQFFKKFKLLFNNSKTFLTRMKDQSCYYISNLKDRLSQERLNHQLKKLPIYLVMGAPQSGKKATLANSGLHFVLAEHYGQEAIHYINQFPDYDWWFTSQAILVDVSLDDKENEITIYKKLIRHLRRRNHNKPINGILLTFSISDLLLANNKNRQIFLNDIANRIRDLYQTLKTQIPVYIIFTKCDLIIGFSEFFNDLSKEELTQVWGITLPLNECTELNNVIAYLNHEYNQLMVRLQQRILWSLDSEKNNRGRELIFSFPQQMQLFKKPITIFISELFGTMRFYHVLQLRGFYFVSAKQSNQSYDFINAAISKQHQLLPTIIKTQEKHEESYFLTQLFQQVIFQEANILGYSLRARRVKIWSYRCVCIVAPIILVLSGSGLHASYSDLKSKITQINENLSHFHTAMENLRTDDPLLIHTLPALNALKRINESLQHAPWLMKTLFSTYRLNNASYDALLRSIHTLYLPRVAAHLETALNNNYTTDTLYALLKAYLAFSPSDYTKPSAIIAPMEYTWAHQFHEQPELQKQLKYYLNLSAQNRLDELPLNRPLINKTRLKLQEIVPAQRAYGLLVFKAAASDYPNLNFASAIGRRFKQIFLTDNDEIILPALYTQLGFQHIFLQQNQSIATQVTEDNREIGLDNTSETTQSKFQIIHQMQSTYNENYRQQWQSTLNHLTIIPFTNFQQAIQVLTILCDKQSPLTQLLNIVYDNTASITHEQINVSQIFSPLNTFGQNTSSIISYQNILITIRRLRDYLITISQATNNNLAAFKAANDYLSGNMKNPIRQLTLEAQKAPEPVGRWLHSIADHSWQLIANSTLHYINTIWSNQVLLEYQQNLQNRYPLTPKSTADITINMFSKFFSYNGILAHFFNHYLSFFIDTNNFHWQLVRIDGHSINLSNHDIQLFHKAEEIRNQYFTKNNPIPKLIFSIQSHTLDNNISSVKLTIGNKIINYQHGPQNSISVTWPLPDDAQIAKIVFNDFSGERYVHSYAGPWAWFRMLDNATVQTTSTKNHYLLRFNVNHFIASYEIVSPINLFNFQLKLIKEFSIPNTL